MVLISSSAQEDGNVMDEKYLEIKKQLVEKAKQLAESENIANVAGEIAALKRQWRRGGGDDESYYEQQLQEQFDKYVDEISKKQNASLLTSEEAKTQIIEKAKALANPQSFKKAQAEMNDLMSQWKMAGSLGKEKDDELWEQFKAARDEFFANKKAFYENRSETYAANKAAKQAIIDEAKKANQLTNMKELTKKMDELMNNWKAVGSAGRDDDESLWQQFYNERKTFFASKKQYYSSLKETFAERAESKKELIATAKKCLANSTFTEEELSTVKGLREQWKAIGHAGKDNEENLWKEFNEILDKYWDNKKYYG